MTLSGLAQPRWLLSSLLIAGAALFAIGVAAERNAADKNAGLSREAASIGESGTAATDPAEEEGGDEAVSTDEAGGEATELSEQPAGEEAEHSEASSETVLGVNLESTALVVVAAAVSLAFAALTSRRNARGVLLATAAFAAVFALFDIAELVHQFEESRPGIATLAAAVAVLHVVATLAAEERAKAAPSGQ